MICDPFFIVHSDSGFDRYWSLCVSSYSLLSSDVGDVSVCPPVALDSGVGLVCRLFELSGQVPAGILTLTQWLLGDEEDNEKAFSDASSLVSIRGGAL